MPSATVTGPIEGPRPEQGEMATQTYRDGYDAIRALFEGYSSHDVAEFFIDNGYWPPMTWGAASARVRSCWSPDGDMFFKVSELIAWSRHTCRRAIVDYFCDELGLPRPGEPGGTSERMEELLTEFRNIERQREALLAEIDEQTKREKGEKGDKPENVTQLGTPNSVRQPRFQRRDGGGDD